MAGANLTTLSDILRYHYADAIANDVMYYSLFLHLANDARAEGFPRMNIKTLETGGTNYRKATRYAGNASFMGVTDDGDFPTEGSQTFKEGYLAVKTSAMTVRISGWVADATKGSKYAAVDALEDELKTVPLDFAVGVDRQLFGYGFGRLCRLSAIAVNADATISVDSQYGMLNAVAPTNGTKLLRVGMPICFYNSTTARNTAIVNFKVLSINSATSFEASPAPVTTELPQNNDWVILGAGGAGTSGKNAYNTGEPNGLLAIVDDYATTYGYVDTIQGIARSSYNFMKANVSRDTALRTYSPILLQNMLDTIADASGQETEMLITTRGVRRAMLENMIAYKHFESPWELDGGFSVIRFNGMPVYVHQNCPDNTIFCLRTSEFVILQMGAPHWRTGGTGEAALEIVPGQDASRAHYLWRMNLWCDLFRCQGRIDDITEPTA